MKLTLAELRKRVGDDEEAAYELLEELRWPTGAVECPHCGHDKAYFLTPKADAGRRTGPGAKRSVRRVWKCAKCRRQFSVLTGTVFQGTKVALSDWLTVMVLMSSAKNGISGREVERLIGVTAETAWFMLHRLREAMKRSPYLEPMQGVIVADETYIGGLEGNKHASKRDGQPKVAVLSLIEKHSGEVRSRVIPDVTGMTLRKAMEQDVDPSESILYTDKLLGYRDVGRQFVAHEVVDHMAEEYVSPTGATTNHAEGYFSQLKRSIDGTHHHVSRKHLQRYLTEFDFRHTTRKLTDTARLQRIVDGAEGRRLTYRPLTAD